MTDVMVYSKDYQSDAAANTNELQWHSNHRVFAHLLPGDRLWVVTSGKALEYDAKSGGYLVAMWPVAQVVENPDDDPEYPARKFGHRVLVNETEAIHLDQPVCVDHIVRGEGYDKSVAIGRFLRGPRRLSDEMVRQLRIAAGADLAQKWLMGNKTPPTPVRASEMPPTPVGGSRHSSNLDALRTRFRQLVSRDLLHPRFTTAIRSSPTNCTTISDFRRAVVYLSFKTRHAPIHCATFFRKS